ncbi:MAG: transcriptional regulator NrdR [Phycisphaerales bacterium]
MMCPFCNASDDRVIDSRASEGGRVVRRRRECNVCSKRFTTYERVEATARLMVVKRDGTRTPFEREKVLKGVQAACGKRAVGEDAILALVDLVEEEAHQEFDREVTSAAIAEKVMRRLKTLDEVAYVRYASEHYQFRDAAEIMRELEALRARIKDVKEQQPLFGQM